MNVNLPVCYLNAIRLIQVMNNPVSEFRQKLAFKEGSIAMRTVEEFEKATAKCQKPMSDYSRIIVETDEKSPKTLAVITDDDCETVEGLRVRFMPVYKD